MLIFCHQIGQQEVFEKLAIRCERRSTKCLPLVTRTEFNELDYERDLKYWYKNDDAKRKNVRKKLLNNKIVCANM